MVPISRGLRQTRGVPLAGCGASYLELVLQSSMCHIHLVQYCAQIVSSLLHAAAIAVTDRFAQTVT